MKKVVSARNSIMDLLARRGHSELELREKLLRRFPEPEVLQAIAFAKENGWMDEPEELAARVAAELSRKKKGHQFIAKYLSEKGLPQVPRNSDSEIEKAKLLIESKFPDGSSDFMVQQKIHRFLLNRGFDHETIRQALRRF